MLYEVITHSPADVGAVGLVDPDLCLPAGDAEAGRAVAELAPRATGACGGWTGRGRGDVPARAGPPAHDRNNFV